MLYARLLHLAFPLVIAEGDTALLQQCYEQLAARISIPPPPPTRHRTISESSRSSRTSRGHIVYDSGKEIYASNRGVRHDLSKPPPYACFHCGGDHWAMHCPSRTQKNSSASRQNSFRWADCSATALPPPLTTSPSRTTTVKSQVMFLRDPTIYLYNPLDPPYFPCPRPPSSPPPIPLQQHHSQPGHRDSTPSSYSYVPQQPRNLQIPSNNSSFAVMRPPPALHTPAPWTSFCGGSRRRSPIMTNLLSQSSKPTSSVYHSRHEAAYSAYSWRLSRWPRSVIQRYPLSRPPGGLVRAPLFDSNQRPAARGSSSIFWIRQNPYTRPPSQWSCTASSCSHSSICSASLSSPLSNHATSVANLLPSGLQNVMAASTGVPYPLPSSAGPVTTENTDLPLKLPTSRALNSNTTSANSYATSAEIWHEFCLLEVLPSHQPSIIPQVSCFQHIPNLLFRVLQPTSPKQSHG